MHRARIAIPFLMLVALAATLFFVFNYAHADLTTGDATCPAGMHNAAANEVPGVAAGTCTPNSGASSANSLLYGGCPSNPYPYLETLKSGNNVLITPSSSGGSLQDGINPTLACRLSQFLQYAQQTNGCRFQINSAYRSAATQANTCASICGNPNGCTGSAKCGTPGGSCHQYGAAVDLTGTSQCMSWAKQFLGSASNAGPGAQQFKLLWPIPSDDGHTQCIENPQGSCSPSTQVCGGNISISPGAMSQRIASQANTPTSVLTNMIRGLMAPQPLQPMQISQPQYSQPPQQYQPTQTGPNGQQIQYDANGQPYYYNSSGQAISATTGQPINPSQTQGQSNGSTNSNGQLNSGLPNLQNTNPGSDNGAGQTQINSGDFNSTSSNATAGNGDSDINYINSLANSLSPAGSQGGAQPGTGTSSPAALNQNLRSGQVAQNGAQNPASAQNPHGDYEYPTILPPDVTQTFATPNSNTGDFTYSSDPRSTFQQLLTKLKGVLVTLSVWLTPFGNRTQNTPSME
jgi:hypothetical protein